MLGWSAVVEAMREHKTTGEELMPLRWIQHVREAAVCSNKMIKVTQLSGFNVVTDHSTEGLINPV